MTKGLVANRIIRISNRIKDLEVEIANEEDKLVELYAMKPDSDLIKPYELKLERLRARLLQNVVSRERISS